MAFAIRTVDGLGPSSGARRNNVPDSPESSFEGKPGLAGATVVFRRGQVVQRVRLPQHRRLVGFGMESLYAVRMDDSGLEFVERYRRPKLLP